MRGINKVIIVGRLGANPETRTFANGGVVTNISVATTEQWKDKVTGEKREATEWHRIALFNRLGEIAAQYLTKGSQVYIEGSLRTRKWTDQNGQERYMTEIRADSLQMLGGGSNQNQQGNYNTQGNYNQQGNYNPQDNYQQGNYNPQGNFNQQGNVAPQNNFNQQGNYNPQGNFNQQGNVAPQQPQAHQVNQGQQATQQVKDAPVANDIPDCFL